MNTLPSAYQSGSDWPADYRIRVRGSIRPSWSDRFEGMTISTSQAPEGWLETTLQGTLPDQAALVGVVNFLDDLRLQVLTVECLSYVTRESADDACCPT